MPNRESELEITQDETSCTLRVPLSRLGGCSLQEAFSLSLLSPRRWEQSSHSPKQASVPQIKVQLHFCYKLTGLRQAEDWCTPSLG